jgi:hypothetical protein
MDVASLASSLVGAQSDQTQSALGVQMLRINANADASVAKLIEAAQQGSNSLANVGPGVGGSLNVSA